MSPATRRPARRISFRVNNVWFSVPKPALATNTTGEKAVEMAERLRDAVQQHNFGMAGKVTASFGVTSYQKGDKPETLIRRADLGLYKAKAGGRNRVEAVRAGITLPLFEGEKPYPVPQDNPGQAGKTETPEKTKQ